MSFRAKIDKILEAKQLERLSINKIEKLLGVDGTIYKAHKDDRYPVDSELIPKLIGKLGIRQQWWDKDWETGSTDIFITHEQKEPAIPEKPLRGDPEVYRTIVEGNTEYVLVHREQFQNDRKIMQHLADQNTKMATKLFALEAELPRVKKSKHSA